MVLLPERNLSIDGVCARGCWGTSEQITRWNNAPECAIRTESHHPRLLLLLRRTWHSTTREIPLRWHRFILWLASCLSCSARWMRPSIHLSILPNRTRSIIIISIRGLEKNYEEDVTQISSFINIVSPRESRCLSVRLLLEIPTPREWIPSFSWRARRGGWILWECKCCFLKGNSLSHLFLSLFSLQKKNRSSSELWGRGMRRRRPQSDRHTRKCDGGG